MKPILFRGASVWDGSGAPAFPADVLVEGDRIKSIARAPERLLDRWRHRHRGAWQNTDARPCRRARAYFIRRSRE